VKTKYLAVFVVASLFLSMTSLALASEANADITLPAVQKSQEHKERLELAKSDPEGFLKLAIKNYNSTVRDYTCVFIKQEFVKGALSKEQKIQVKFREGPFAVFMKWLENPGLVDHVLYVKGLNGNEAMVKPAGILGFFVRSHVNRPVDGPDAAKVSRRRLDQFGFKNGLQLILEVNELAKKNKDLRFNYSGTGTIDGRPTFIFERYLPDKPCYFDQHVVLHIDQEWLVPVATYCYDARERLLGKYIYTDVKLNIGLAFKEFTAEACDL
jgi:hypothetical protein